MQVDEHDLGHSDSGGEQVVAASGAARLERDVTEVERGPHVKREPQAVRCRVGGVTSEV